jgi:molybdate transport system substrate-binding protein
MTAPSLETAVPQPAVPLTRARLSRVAALLLSVAAATAGCGGSSAATSSAAAGSSPAASGSAGVTGTLTVFAAASLTGAFTELGKQFEAAHPGTTVRFSFGSSSTLAQQIVAGAPADVFASASAKSMAQVTAGGDATGPVTFATNTAEIAVAPSSAGRVSSLADLGKPGVKVALCQVQVPCGALAQKVLDEAGVTVKPVTEGLDVKATLAYVTSGEADAAVVYVTDVKAAGAKVRGVEVPAAQNASTAYPIATVKGARNPAAAAAFSQLVLSPAGRSVLTGAGFSAP